MRNKLIKLLVNMEPDLATYMKSLLMQYTPCTDLALYQLLQGHFSLNLLCNQCGLIFHTVQLNALFANPGATTFTDIKLEGLLMYFELFCIRLNFCLLFSLYKHCHASIPMNPVLLPIGPGLFIGL
jgi:hypothetical protein